MFVVGHPEGHVVVWQRDHAAMCSQLARVWGNHAFGGFEPRAVVVLAVERHEMGMDGELPVLNPATGLPKDFDDLSHAEHLPAQFSGPEQLAAIEPYAGLLASLHHQSFYRRTSWTALLTRDGRLERRALRQSAALQRRVRAAVSAPEAQVTRNQRLLRYWDGLSHDLLFARWPRVREGVPAADGADRAIALAADNAHQTLDPWPLNVDNMRLTVPGRLLRDRYSDQAALRAAVDAAPVIELEFVLEPA